jgi:dTDP-4-dehydrorhamnose 3,5-epimerase
MRVLPTEIPGVRWIEPRVHHDSRGFFLETFQQDRYRALGIAAIFFQDNHSRSMRGILRGLHYQLRQPQGKLCYVARGEVFDVIVDLRSKSPTFGAWAGMHLNDANHSQIYVPPGLAHGFCVLSDWADFIYKCETPFDPEDQHTLAWNDPEIEIQWPIESPILSDKDRQGLSFSQSQKFDLVF